MEKKKSSIDWLVQELNHNVEFIPLVNHWDKIRDIIQQAKAMHKEEIRKTINDTQESFWGVNYQSFNQYYNETFGGQDNE